MIKIKETKRLYKNILYVSQQYVEYGPTGPTGDNGMIIPVGLQGPRGISGPQGPTGGQGSQGLVGATGSSMIIPITHSMFNSTVPYPSTSFGFDNTIISSGITSPELVPGLGVRINSTGVYTVHYRTQIVGNDFLGSGGTYIMEFKRNGFNFMTKASNDIVAPGATVQYISMFSGGLFTNGDILTMSYAGTNGIALENSLLTLKRIQ